MVVEAENQVEFIMRLVLILFALILGVKTFQDSPGSVSVKYKILKGLQMDQLVVMVV